MASTDTRTGAANQEGSQPGAGQLASNGEGTQPGGGDPSSSSNAGLYTQEQMDEIITARLGKQLGKLKSDFKRSLESEQQAAIATWRSEHGLDDDEALDQWKKRQDAAGEEAQNRLRAKTLERESATLKTLLETERKAREKERALLSRTLTHDALLREASALSNAPDIVADVLSKHLRLDDDYNVTVVNEAGEPTGKTIKALVEELLANRPMLRLPSGQPGAGSRPASAGSAPSAKFDFNKQSDRLAYIAAARAGGTGR